MRKGSCPNCGGPIELKVGSSQALVCPWCRYSVVRTDRSFEAIGKVADLVPTAADFAVGDILGVGAELELRVAGRIQLDHGRGPWDEYYVAVNGEWGWLAKAQGSWLLTRSNAATGLPSWSQLTAGQQGHLPTSSQRWTVQEQGHSTVLSAEGELPFPVRSGERGRFVDLAASGEKVATIDYGDGSEAPRLYVGEVVERPRVVSEAAGPRPEQKVKLGKLACPTCGAPVELRAKGITESTVCTSCSSILDVSAGNLRFVAEQVHVLQPAIPLGTEGTLQGEELVCIGAMEREVEYYGVVYYWREYLLHCKNPGPKSKSEYRWLVEDNGHWNYVHPVGTGDVTEFTDTARFAGKSYRIYNHGPGTVSSVVGEFYWQVRQGQTSSLRDFIRPPYIISCERNRRQEQVSGPNADGVSTSRQVTEVAWSAGEYIEADALWKAFGLTTEPPRTQGVGAAQPNPHRIGWAFFIAAALFMGLLAVSIGSQVVSNRDVVASMTIPMPAISQPEPAPTGQGASFSAPFEVPSTSTMEVEINTTSDNEYIGVVGALINQSSGEVIEFYLDAGFYHGISGGESWREGSKEGDILLSGVPAGTYVMRVDPYWTSYSQPGALPSHGAPEVQLSAALGRHSAAGWLCTLFFLLLPLGWTILRHSGFEKRRQENSNLD